MKILIFKLVVLLLCVPVYPFITIGMWFERNSYYGGNKTFRKVNRDYWEDVWYSLTYKKEDD